MAQPIWTTAAGTLGTFPEAVLMSTSVVADAVAPATTVTYQLLSGTLPPGLMISSAGVISGTPVVVNSDTTTTFTIRATDNLSNIRDRTFSLEITGDATPEFTMPSGNLISPYPEDSIWLEFQVGYSNPDAANPVAIILQDGELPPGLEIDGTGMVRGYADQPTMGTAYSLVSTDAYLTFDTTNTIRCVSTNLFAEGRPVIFTGSIGGITSGATYYIKSIVSTTDFTISETQYGYVLPLTADSVPVTVTLPAATADLPTVRTYMFELALLSPLGNITQTYSITVVNQDIATPGIVRIPTILNTRPLTYNVTADIYYRYYVLPPVLPSVEADIGLLQNNEYFAFKIIGYDFEGGALTYTYTGLAALGLIGDPYTGWITGTPSITTEAEVFNFSVKVTNSGEDSAIFNFTTTVTKDISVTVTWVTPSDLGTLYNGTVSTFSVLATADVPLKYSLVSGTLPPNLSLIESNGEIVGCTADQPTDILLSLGDSTLFTFTIQAYSDTYLMITSVRTFTITVLQEFAYPTDTLYCEASASLTDRSIINSLLTNTTLIPPEYLYRSDDIYFGKATGVIYEHSYGVYAKSIAEYLAAVSQNHYWRNITLGQLNTALARNDSGEALYEVVYSAVIDNIANMEPGASETTSVSDEEGNIIYWERPIDLGLGPLPLSYPGAWYTSITYEYTSYADLNQLDVQSYYTSLTPGYARILYPNSLLNMRNRIAEVVGQEYNSKLLPRWMTSQQENGSTLGYTQAWVMCYVLPRIVVDGIPLTYDEFTKTGLNRANYQSYAEIIKSNIQTTSGTPASTSWPYTLNQINFKLDRFSVDKSLTYNYINGVKFDIQTEDRVPILTEIPSEEITTEGIPDPTKPPQWMSLPSASPTPVPLNSDNFYVLFPRQTILPDEPQ